VGGEWFVNADFTQFGFAQAGEDGDGDEQWRLAAASDGFQAVVNWP